MVEVHHHYAERRPLPARTKNLLVENFQNPAVVQKTCLRIVGCFESKILAGF